MARPKNPLKLQKGNLTVLQQVEKENSENAVKVSKDQLEKPPSWLVNTVAVAEYKRIVKLLKEIDIVDNLELNNLACYCNAYALYRDATDNLMQTGMVVMGANGSPCKNPLIAIQKTYSDEMKNYAKMCGLTIDSRLKIGSQKTEETQQGIEDIFGAI